MNRVAVPAKASDPLAEFRRSTIRAAIVIGVISVIFGAALGYLNPFLNRSASLQGVWVDLLFSVLLGVAGTIFMVVEATLIYSIIKYRSRGGDGDEDEGLPIHGSVGLEILWTAVPAVLVTAAALASYGVLVVTEVPQRDAIVVEATGQQFAWSFYYPSLDVTSTELHVPVGQQILVKLHSKDVIHQFWVPDFRIKKDVMPDRVTEVRFTANKEGTYPVVCTKICGAGHALMRSNVIAQKPDDYDAWLSGVANGASQLADANDPLAKGRQVFVQNGCNACHKLEDAKAVGAVGPSLNGIGTQAGNQIKDSGYRGTAKSAEEYIHESIVQPNAYIVPGYQPNIMPQTFGQQIQQADLDALVKYLLAQK